MTNIYPKIKSQGRGSRVEIVSADPGVGESAEGQQIINSSTNELKIFYEDSWRVLHTFTITLDFVLMETGDFLLKEDGDKLALE